MWHCWDIWRSWPVDILTANTQGNYTSGHLWLLLTTSFLCPSSPPSPNWESSSRRNAFLCVFPRSEFSKEELEVQLIMSIIINDKLCKRWQQTKLMTPKPCQTRDSREIPKAKLVQCSSWKYFDCNHNTLGILLVLFTPSQIIRIYSSYKQWHEWS